MSPVFDSYVRLTETALQRVVLVHLQSGLDSNEDRNELRAFEAGSLLPSIAGYTEWISEEARAVSVGWDWVVSSSGEPTLSPHSVRTNTMLVDEQGIDLGHQATTEAVIRAIHRLPWPPAVLLAVQTPANNS